MADEKPPAPPAQTQALAEQREGVAIAEAGLAPKNLPQLYRLAQYVQQSGLAPKGLKTPEQVLIAMQVGMEANMTPMAALRSVVVINGAPSWKGDSALALVRKSGLLAHFKHHETIGEPAPGTLLKDWPDACHDRIDIQRVGCDAKVYRFSVADARTAKLWMKKGNEGQDTPWITYPKRMLYYRNLGFALREEFPEILLGLRVAEEQADIPRIGGDVALAAAADQAHGRTSPPPPPQAPPASDPFLDGMVPPSPVEQGDRKAREKQERAEQLRAARQMLRDEIGSRTGGAEDDMRDLTKDVLKGKAIDEATADEITAAAEALMRHPVFGDKSNE